MADLSAAQTEAADRLGEALAHLLATVALLDGTGDEHEVSRLVVAAGEVDDRWREAHAGIWRGDSDQDGALHAPLIHAVKRRAGEHLASPDSAEHDPVIRLAG